VPIARIRTQQSTRMYSVNFPSHRPYKCTRHYTRSLLQAAEHAYGVQHPVVRHHFHFRPNECKPATSNATTPSLRCILPMPGFRSWERTVTSSCFTLHAFETTRLSL
jgi:hypothetical protein